MHVPEPRLHLVRYYGHYSSAARAQRRTGEAVEEAAAEAPKTAATSAEQEPSAAERRRLRRQWARLIRRIYEADLMGWTPPRGMRDSRWITNDTREESEMESRTIAVDIAKNVFQIAISPRPGKIEKEARVSRAKFLDFMARQKSARVILESCGSAHHWGRELRKLDHDPVLLPVRHVAPYRVGNKTDRADTHAMLEACRNEQIRPVPIKSIEQQALISLHRLRSTWVATRTARMNTVRGILRELGFVIPQGARHVVPRAWDLVESADSLLPMALRPALAEMILEIQVLDERVQETEKQMRQLADQIQELELLQTIPGIGLITASALIAVLGDVERFPTARHLSSFLGLTPRESSSGDRRRLGRITKRGDSYLRMLLVHGARAALWAGHRVEEPDRLRAWAMAIEQRSGHNKACCALANKLARIVWAVWRSGEPYRAPVRVS
jgi:transposase